jgi:glycosyltransferase involved in cell wall biosynthesis
MAYDEAASLEGVVLEIQAALRRTGRAFEVLVVDDGSTDGTGAVADRLAATLEGIRVIHHGTNLGLGGVYRTGFRNARCGLVTFFPADGQFPADILERFAPLMGGCDMVLGYLPGGRHSVAGRLLSWGERIVYRLLFGPLPRFQGILMFRRRMLDGLELRSDGRGWAVLMELIIRSVWRGARVRNEPTAIRPRLSGRSKVQNARTVWSNLRQTIALRRVLGSRRRAMEKGRTSAPGSAVP